MKEEIIEAIQNQNIIEIVYENEAFIVEPYCYGLTTIGIEGLIAFQLKSKISKTLVGWRMYYLDKAADINILKETFVDIREHKKIGNIEMDVIFAKL